MIKPKKFYLAAPWVRKDRARTWRAMLEAKGFKCTARWIDFNPPIPTPQEISALEAKQDIADIQAADFFVMVNIPGSAGGMHFESGYAFAEGMPIFVVGEPSNVFHYHPSIKIVKTAEDIEKCLK